MEAPRIVGCPTLLSDAPGIEQVLGMAQRIDPGQRVLGWALHHLEKDRTKIDGKMYEYMQCALSDSRNGRCLHPSPVC